MNVGSLVPAWCYEVLFAPRRRKSFRNILFAICSQLWNVSKCIYLLKGLVRKESEMSNERLTIGIIM